MYLSRIYSSSYSSFKSSRSVSTTLKLIGRGYLKESLSSNKYYSNYIIKNIL
jgi:hypothetical protein